MSADKRKTILISFAGLVVILVAVIAVVSPKFRSEDAMGAIGAVQKHRAPQISQADVILGDEQTRQQQQLLYGDFLADAAALQSMSANIATAARAESTSRLSARKQELQARYLAAARAQVVGMKALFAADKLEMAKLEAIDSDIASAGTRVQSRDEIDSLNARLASEFASLDARLNVRNLASIEADVAGLGARVESQKNLDAARSTLAAAAQALDARSNAGSMIRARAMYLDATAKECSALQSAEEALSTGARAESILRDEAQALGQRALVNMRTNLDSETAAVDSFGHMSTSLDAVSRAVESRANTYNASSLASFRQESSAFARAVASRNNEAQARATADMRGQLNHISNYLGSVRNLDARAASRANIAECTAQLQSINHAAQSRTVYASVLADSQELANYSLKSRNQ